MPDPKASTVRWQDWAPALLVLAAVGIAYANSLANGFARDDGAVIVLNDRIKDLTDFGAIWLSPYWPRDGGDWGLYRPLPIFGYAVQWALGAGTPVVFHATSMLLHGAVAVLVLFLLRSLVEAPAALIGALIFAVHPVATEAVANVVGQAELLAALGVVGACVLYVRRPEGRPGAARIAAIVACYLVGLASKENAIVLPALLVALDLATGRLPTRGLTFRASAARVLPLYLALCCAALLYFGLRFVVLDSAVGTITPSLPFRDDPGVRILTAFRCWIEYARLLFFPLVLSADYSPAVILPASSWTPLVIIGAALIGALLVLATRIRIQPGAGLPALWFLITILPVSNLIFPTAILVAERTLYTPAVSVAMVAAFLLSAAIRSSPAPGARRLAFAAATIVVVAFGARTVTRNPEWQSSATIMAALMRDHPESYVAQWRTALEAADQGKDAAAADHFELAYRIWPHNAHLLINYAQFLLEHGEPGRAVGLLEQALSTGRAAARTRELLEIAEAARAGSPVDGGSQ